MEVRLESPLCLQVFLFADGADDVFAEDRRVGRALLAITLEFSVGEFTVGLTFAIV